MDANRRSRRRASALLRGRPAGSGFTLVELLVVILIIGLVSAATLPVVLPALAHRQVSEGARLLQATIVGARDSAIRANAPRGIRLMPDPAFPGGPSGVLAANRMIAIEPAPDYNSGRVSIYNVAGVNNPLQGVIGNLPNAANHFTISVMEEVWANPAPIGQTFQTGGYNTIPNEPTTWFWNIRQGDKIRFDDAGTYYTVAGPFQRGAYYQAGGGTYTPYNVDRYVNYGDPGYVFGPGGSVQNNPNPLAPNHYPEILFLVNGLDDDNDGWVDEAFDGIDNDGDGITDPGYNGIDDNGNGLVDEFAELLIGYTGAPGSGEWEPEKFVGDQMTGSFLNKAYTIYRRPVVSENAREVALPQGVVIDMTTWNAGLTVVSQNNRQLLATAANIIPLPERSRLPVDPFSYYVDIMIAPNGQVVTTGGGTSMVASGTANASPTSNLPFYHFWIAEREDVFPPMWGIANFTAGAGTGQGPLVGVPVANPGYSARASLRYLLPMTQDAPNYVLPNAGSNGPYLKGDRRLVTLFVKTGQVVTNEIETFNGLDTSVPFYSAQFGTREAK